jgi:IclR family mhp operon transcriptional activator
MPKPNRLADDLTEASSDASQYKEVRGLTRGLALLRALNTMPGGQSSTSDLARACGIHRTTAKRILETLRTEGVVQTGEREGQYRLAPGARQLSDGYRDEDWITNVAAPMLANAAPANVWPCNLATFAGGCMVIRASTRRGSALAHYHAMLGERLPLLRSSLGRAYLAAIAATEPARLQPVLGELAQRAVVWKVDTKDLEQVHEVIAQTHERGHAVNSDVAEARFSSIGVAVLCGQRVLGAVNLVFTKQLPDAPGFDRRYIERLKALAQDIGVGAKSWMQD